MASGEENLGGGTGGGADDSGNVLLSANGAYQIAGNQVVLLSRPPVPDLPAMQGSNVILILAAGHGTDGDVDIRGSKGVRVTAGPPLNPVTSSDSTNGVEVIVGETQTITIQRGVLPNAQQIEQTPGGTKIRCGLLPTAQLIELTPAGITVDGELGKVTIQSFTEIDVQGQGPLAKITLSVGPAKLTLGQEGITLSAGLSEITLGLEGITITGIPVQINPPGGAARTWGA
jgi:hypothetical protein